MTDASDDRRDFFVSFNQADREWATWIAWVLKANGHGVFFQDWDFRGSFVEQMHQATLRAEYARSKVWAALARDPVGRQDRVVLFKVGPTGDLGLLAHFAHVDLTSAAEGEAEGLLLGRARMSLDPAHRPVPAERPRFPGRGTPPRPSLPAPAPGPPPAGHTAGAESPVPCDTGRWTNAP